MSAPQGERNPRWNGGTWINSKGYVMIRVGREHPMANCRHYAPRCRVVCYETHGPPQPGQHAHHKNGDKQDDRPENLEWSYESEHGRFHLPKGSQRARDIGRKGGKATARMRKRAKQVGRSRQRTTR